jgi:hypothetical protein
MMSTHLPLQMVFWQPAGPASGAPSGWFTTELSGWTLPASKSEPASMTTPASLLSEGVLNPHISAHAEVEIARTDRSSAMARDAITVPGSSAVSFPSRKFNHGLPSRTAVVDVCPQGNSRKREGPTGVREPRLGITISR